MTSKPPADNLNICNDHRLAMHSDEEAHGRCPACILEERGHEIEVDHDIDVPGKGPIQQEVRQRLEAEDVAELVPLMTEYLADNSEDPPVLTVEKFTGQLPAGYSDSQERWLNAVVYKYGARTKALTRSPNAHDTIEKLRSEGYGDD